MSIFQYQGSECTMKSGVPVEISSLHSCIFGIAGSYAGDLWLRLGESPIVPMAVMGVQESAGLQPTHIMLRVENNC